MSGNVFAIGDVQGCYPELMDLLEKIHFRPGQDEVWFVGDLVSRGGQSLEVLRTICDLGKSAKVVLGNHDLHLLAQWYKKPKKRKSDEEFQRIFAAPDALVLRDWLRKQPLLHRDREIGFVMCHAGLSPDWKIRRAAQYAEEVSARLRGKRPQKFLKEMYGNKPARWNTSLTGTPRLRVITNFLTRVRFVNAKGKLLADYKGPPEAAPDRAIPWYEAMRPLPKKTPKLVFGHWSALGLYQGKQVFGIDTGCVWGGHLTALNLKNPQEVVQVAAYKHRR